MLKEVVFTPKRGYLRNSHVATETGEPVSSTVTHGATDPSTHSRPSAQPHGQFAFPLCWKFSLCWMNIDAPNVEDMP